MLVNHKHEAGCMMLLTCYTYIYLLADPRAQLAESRRLLSELGARLTEQNTSIHPYLKSINALLRRAELTAESAMHDQVPQFLVNEVVAPGKKNEIQPRFHATTKKTGRKRKGNVLK